MGVLACNRQGCETSCVTTIVMNMAIFVMTA
jgi:hypothetical protein